MLFKRRKTRPKHGLQRYTHMSKTFQYIVRSGRTVHLRDSGRHVEDMLRTLHKCVRSTPIDKHITIDTYYYGNNKLCISYPRTSTYYINVRLPVYTTCGNYKCHLYHKRSWWFVERSHSVLYWHLATHDHRLADGCYFRYVRIWFVFIEYLKWAQTSLAFTVDTNNVELFDALL